MARSVYFNGKFYLSRGRFAQAVLIEDGIFRALGNNEELLSAAGNAERIDCEGRTVLPGLNDSHLHLMMLGEDLTVLKLNDCRSVDEIIKKARAYRERYPQRTKEALYGRGWNQDFFSDEVRIPTRQDLDRIATDIPVVFERVCGHILVTNTRAIEALGLDGGSPQYEGGTFQLGPDGSPNGVFTEFACRHPLALIPRQTIEEKKAGFLQAMQYAVSRGLTSVQSTDLGAYQWDNDTLESIIDSVYRDGLAPLRYRYQSCFPNPEAFQQSLKEGLYRPENRRQKGLLSVGPLKLFKDGSLGARTAMIHGGYADDPGNVGEEAMSAELADTYCRLAAENQVQVITHVIGDQAVSDMIDSYEKVMPGGKNLQRHSLVHCQITDAALLRRIQALGVLVQYQSCFIEYDRMICDARVGAEKASTSYAFGTLARLGAHVSYGSDCPVEDCNPFKGIYYAVTRQGLDGTPAGGWYPQERVDVETAIDAYTAGSAYNEFMEDYKGRIREGYAADMVILDRDIFSVAPQEIKDILPVRTVVDGKCVYQNSSAFS